uniref:Putative gtpase activating protein n=1 Tax=Schistosoma mansoni TaxID=6183 RepID=A0A5K4EHN9_SCHMA
MDNMNIHTNGGKNYSWNSTNLSSSGPTLLKKFLQKAAETASSSIDFNLSLRKAEKRYVFHPESFSNLIIQDKPTSLHRNKSMLEVKMHALERDKHKSSSRRRRLQKSYTTDTDIISYEEDRQQSLLKVWRYDVLTHWKSGYPSKNVRQYFWEGVPSAVRNQVWSLLLGNKLGITRELFNTCLSQSKHHVETNISQHSGIIQYERTNSNHNEHYSLLNLSNTENSTFNCVMCNFIFSKLNTIPIKREFTRVPFVTRNFKKLHEHYTKTSSEGEELEEAIVSANSFKIDPSEFEHSYRIDYTVNLHAIKVDMCQIFPTLNLFSPGYPYHKRLHDLLAAFISYKPEIGYIPGMSWIAGMALIVFDNTYDAFVTFANILNRSYHQAFYSMDEEKFLLYFNDFDKLFSRCLPRLYKHFKEVGFETTMFLFDWFFTLFSRILPLETCIRIWDLYFLYEESALFYAALAILKLCEKDLLSCNFDDLSSYLSGATLLQSLTPDTLIISMYSFHHLKRFNTSNMNKTRQVASRESLFAMNQLPLYLSKDDVTGSTFRFPSTYSIPRDSFHCIPKSGPIDHSVRSPRSISDESDGALDIDDQYFKPKSGENPYAKVFITRYNKPGQTVTHDMNGDSNSANGTLRKVNKSTEKTNRCTNPCFFRHTHLQSFEERLEVNPHRMLPQFYSSYSQDHLTAYHIPALRQNIRISNMISRTSAEIIP